MIAQVLLLCCAIGTDAGDFLLVQPSEAEWRIVLPSSSQPAQPAPGEHGRKTETAAPAASTALPASQAQEQTIATPKQEPEPQRTGHWERRCGRWGCTYVWVWDW